MSTDAQPSQPLGTLHGPEFQPGGFALFDLTAGQHDRPRYAISYRPDGHIFIRSHETGNTVAINTLSLVAAAIADGIDKPIERAEPVPETDDFHLT